MATLNLAAYKPSSGQSVSASPISNAFTAIEAAANSIDNTQFAAGRIFDPTKLIEASSVQRIADSTLGAPAASIDLTSISANFLHLLVCAYLRDDRAAATRSNTTLRLNNDSGANYDYQFVDLNGTTVTGTRSSGQTSMGLVPCPAVNGTANRFGSAMLLLANYANVTNHKTVLSFGSELATTVAADCQTNVGSGIWTSASAVNRITFLPQGTNFVTGSRVSIYGLG